MRSLCCARLRFASLLIVGTSSSFVLAQSPATPSAGPKAAVDQELAIPKIMRVLTAGAPLHKPDKTVANLGRGTRIEVSKVREGWIGGYALLGDTRVPGWILRADLQAVPKSDVVEASVAKLTELRVTVERDAQNNPSIATAGEAKLTDDDLVAFLPLVDLVEIDLSGTAVTSAGMKSLAGLAGLERLHLDNTAIDDEGLLAIASLVNLSGLSLSETKVTDKGLKHLAGMKQIKVLNLADTTITDAGLAHLANMKGMETLTLSRTDISGKGFSHFQDFQDLITLNLDGCGLGPKALSNFEKLEKIRILRMYEALVPQEDIDALEKAVDGLAIFR